MLGVVAVLQQVGGEAVAEGMTADPLRDPGQAGSISHRALQRVGAGVMAPRDARARVGGKVRGREDVLPDPFLASAGQLPFESIGQEHGTGSRLQIGLVEAAHSLQVLPQRRDERFGEHGDSIAKPLALPDHNLALGEVDVLPQRTAGRC